MSIELPNHPECLECLRDEGNTFDTKLLARELYRLADLTETFAIRAAQSDFTVVVETARAGGLHWLKLPLLGSLRRAGFSLHSDRSVEWTLRRLGLSFNVQPLAVERDRWEEFTFSIEALTAEFSKEEAAHLASRLTRLQTHEPLFSLFEVRTNLKNPRSSADF